MTYFFVFKLFVKNPNGGSSFMMNANIKDTVAILKQKIYDDSKASFDRKKFSLKNIRVLFSGKNLLEEERTLMECQIRNESYINYLLEDPDGDITIRRVVDNSEIILNVHLKDSIRKIKQKIKAKCTNVREDFDIYFGKVHLNDLVKSLEEYGFEFGKTLELREDEHKITIYRILKDSKFDLYVQLTDTIDNVIDKIVAKLGADNINGRIELYHNNTSLHHTDWTLLRGKIPLGSTITLVEIS